MRPVAKYISAMQAAHRNGKDKSDILIPGEWYYIQLTDCCIEGNIVGQFICFWNEIETIADGGGFEYETLLSTKPEDEYWEALFTFGLLGPYWGEWYPMRLKTREK